VIITPIVARINLEKKLKLKGNIFTTWTSFEQNENLDDIYQIEENYQLDDTLEIGSFLNYIFDLSEQQSQIDIISFDKQGNLLCSEVYTIWQGFNGIENIDSANINWDTTYSIDLTNGIEDLLSYFFNLEIQNIPIDKFKILGNKRLLLSEVLENQIL